MDISGWVSNFFGQVGDLLDNVLCNILNLLPDSPFEFLAQTGYIYKYLQYLNWIVPVSFFVSTLQVWLVAVAIYYVWQLILRWLKAIE
ncbi:MAG: hypothetical protein Q4B62_08845 [Clostridiaceae bacterium]|nr:hypothetical protein [Clostridiaceae bacterium]MDO4495878.1 hypothetical protein [Clostridiaceae bacterium]